MVGAHRSSKRQAADRHPHHSRAENSISTQVWAWEPAKLQSMTSRGNQACLSTARRTVVPLLRIGHLTAILEHLLHRWTSVDRLALQRHPVVRWTSIIIRAHNMVLLRTRLAACISLHFQWPVQLSTHTPKHLLALIHTLDQTARSLSARTRNYPERHPKICSGQAKPTD